MTTIEKVTRKLAAYSAIQWTSDAHSIRVETPKSGGFSVWLKVNDPGFTVGFDGWHEEFDTEEEALNCFAFGLSDRCRLKVVRRGNFDCSWTVESKSNGEWTEDSTVGLFLVPFWRRKRVEHRQNSLLQV